MRRHLVIARVGQNSLHRFWLDAGKERNWDLYLCPFQNIPTQDHVPCTVGEVLPGPKWTGLTRLLNGWNGWRDYEYIWLPDDDIFTSQDAINAMFEVGEALDFNLFAPGLHETSFYAHYIAMANRSFFARRVGFVEIMIPCFRRTALEQLLPTFELSTTGWGWGLDSVWPKLLDYEGLGIIDGITVVHTRPVGQFRDAELRRRVNDESDHLLESFACSQQMASFAAIDENLGEHVLGPDELLVRLVEGWSYLFESDPRILRWIVEHQRSSFAWPQYLIEGAPNGPRRWRDRPPIERVLRRASEQQQQLLAADPIASAHVP
jgi:hypothetical protein